MSPLNCSTDSIRSRHVVSNDAAATADAVTDGKRNAVRQNVGNRRETASRAAVAAARRSTDRRRSMPLQILPPLLLDLHRLQQQEPTVRRQDSRPMAPGAAAGPTSVTSIRSSEPGSVAWKSRTGGSIRSRRRKTRSDRIVPIRAKTSDDAAANGELAGQIDRRRMDQPVFGQPSGQLPDRHRARPPAASGLPLERFAIRDRLQQALDARHDQFRRHRPVPAVSADGFAGRKPRLERSDPSIPRRETVRARSA